MMVFSLIGPSIFAVREDITNCLDVRLMEKQVMDAIKQSKLARKVAPKQDKTLKKP